MLQWKITVFKSIDKIRFTDNDVVHMIRRTGIFWYDWGDVDMWYCCHVTYSSDVNRRLVVVMIVLCTDHAGNSCPQGCYGRGDCIDGQCHCFAGFTGWDCKHSLYIIIISSLLNCCLLALFISCLCAVVSAIDRFSTFSVTHWHTSTRIGTRNW